MTAAMRSRTERDGPPGRTAPATPHIGVSLCSGHRPTLSSTLSMSAVPADLTMSAPDIGPRERELIAEVMSGTQLSFGPMLDRFEAGVAARSFSFVASTNCLLYEGATPVFADIDPETYDLDPSSVEQVIASSDVRPTALLPVDVFG